MTRQLLAPVLLWAVAGWLPLPAHAADKVKVGFISTLSGPSAALGVDIQGGMDAKLMRDWLEDGKSAVSDRDPYAVSHLGWGMNPQALWYGIALHGDLPERHRAAARTFPGNFLFSTGPNTQGGGKRNTRGHYDVPMRDCTVELDGKVVIERGKIVDDKMRVKREPR